MTQGITDGEETVVKIEEIRSLSGNVPTATGSMYAWNQKGGVTASSTRNMTGVYDLSGGLWERTAAYIANEHASLSRYGKSVAYINDTLQTVSTKYTIVYPFDNNMDNREKEDNETNLNMASEANYIMNTKIYGDAVREISSTGINNSSWEQKISVFMGLYHTFMVRGGFFWNLSKAGIFNFDRHQRK